MTAFLHKAPRYLFGYDAVESKNRRQAPTGRLRSEDKELLPHQRRKLTSAARDIHRNFTIAAWAIRKHLDYVSTFPRPGAWRPNLCRGRSRSRATTPSRRFDWWPSSIGRRSMADRGKEPMQVDIIGRRTERVLIPTGPGRMRIVSPHELPAGKM
jgi:hypothetical protein